MDRVSKRPAALPVSPSAIPDLLKALPQWVMWRYTWREGKWTKLPYDARTGELARSTGPSTWGSFEAVWTAYQTGDYDGIGFALREDNGLVGIDLDHCRDPDTGEIDAWAQDIIASVSTYWEVSPSGTGLRGLAKGSLPPQGRKKGDVEMYTGGRYLTVTGCHLDGTPLAIEAPQEAIITLHARIFGQREQTTCTHEDGTLSPLDDDALLERALAARNAGKFARPWAGDRRGYPSASEADMALCCLLAFWTGDAAQIDRLFRRSALMRDKWDAQHGEMTYGERTIAQALSRVTERWTPAMLREHHHSPNGGQRRYVWGARYHLGGDYAS